MPLSAASLAANIGWTLSRSNTGFGSTKQGADSKSVQIQPAVATFNQVLAQELIIGVGSNTTLDLQSFVNLVGESVSLTKACGIIVIPSGSDVKVEPGASNGLAWFFGGTTPSVTIPAGGCLFFTQPSSQTVSSTSKTIKLTNVGSAALTVDVVIIGGT